MLHKSGGLLAYALAQAVAHLILGAETKLRANSHFTPDRGYLQHQNGSTPRDRRASAKRRNKLRARGQHRKAVR